MLDAIIRNGRVVTPQGAGAWEAGIEGERIAAVAAAGSLPGGRRGSSTPPAGSSCPGASTRTRTWRSRS